MDIKELKENIKKAISEPCVPKHTTRGYESGVSEDGKYIMMKVTPDDTSWKCMLTDDYVERILEQIHPKYRDHLVSVKHDGWLSYSYVPVFDEETQAVWDKEYNDYVSKKADFMMRYGCD